MNRGPKTSRIYSSEEISNDENLGSRTFWKKELRKRRPKNTKYLIDYVELISEPETKNC